MSTFPRAEHWDEYFEREFDRVTDEMVEKGIVITPESLCQYWQDDTGLAWTPEEAEAWLKTQAWYTTTATN